MPKEAAEGRPYGAATGFDARKKAEASPLLF